MATFNAEALLNQQTTEANSTELLNVPEGDYTAVSDPVGADSFKEFDIKNGPNAGKKGLQLIVQWTINDDSGALREFLGRAPKIRQQIFLDRRDDGSMEMGKGRNVGLGQLREALGQNSTGAPWSFGMLGGQVAKVKVKHRQLDDGRTMAEVAAVAKA